MALAIVTKDPKDTYNAPIHYAENQEIPEKIQEKQKQDWYKDLPLHPPEHPQAFRDIPRFGATMRFPYIFWKHD